jgi:S1-C subfamily serine protease
MEANMVDRSLRIPVWLISAFLFATAIGSSAERASKPNTQSSFRIVTRNVGDVITQDVTPEIARALHMDRAEGVLVTRVLSSPLHERDVILSINGNPVGCQKELDEQLAEISPGETFFVEVLRDGEIQTVTVQRAILTLPPPAVLQGTVEIRGITVASLPTEEGVLVTDVKIGTPASDLGLMRGDIILDVDGHPVHTAAEFLSLMRQIPNRLAAFNVLHPNCQIDVFVIS